MTPNSVNPVNLREPSIRKGSRQKTDRRNGERRKSVNLVNLFYTWVWGNTDIHGGYSFAYRVHKVHTFLESRCSLSVFSVNPRFTPTDVSGNAVWTRRIAQDRPNINTL